MKVAEALERLVDMHVPGAVEATALLPTAQNAVLNVVDIGAPLLMAATYVGASHVLDEAARLTDLNLPIAMQKKFAVYAMFTLGAESWDGSGRFHAKRLSAEAKRLFERTFVGFVFYKHRRLLATSGVLLAASVASMLFPIMLRLWASFWLERAAGVMGTDAAIALQYLKASRQHENTYGRLRKVLASVRSHGSESVPELAPFTAGRITELADRDAEFFAKYNIVAFRALADHVDKSVQDWVQTQNGSDAATRLLAQVAAVKEAVVEPVANTVSRLTPVLLTCLAIALSVAVVRQADVFLFDNDTSDRRRAGRVANTIAIAGGVTTLVYAARKAHTRWLPTVAIVTALVAAKQFFTVWKPEAV